MGPDSLQHLKKMMAQYTQGMAGMPGFGLGGMGGAGASGAEGGDDDGEWGRVLQNYYYCHSIGTSGSHAPRTVLLNTELTACFCTCSC
jgi:hypothetical protein